MFFNEKIIKKLNEDKELRNQCCQMFHRNEGPKNVVIREKTPFYSRISTVITLLDFYL